MKALDSSGSTYPDVEIEVLICYGFLVLALVEVLCPVRCLTFDIEANGRYCCDYFAYLMCRWS